jgi:3-oxoacyl-[acyl-carrier protein] reductase
VQVVVELFEPGSVAVVTGASRGIGRAVVRALAQEGVKVFFTYRENEEMAKKFCDDLRASGLSAEAHQLDVCDESQVCEYFRMIRKSGLRLDAMVNSVGIIDDGLVATMPTSRFRKVIDVNVIGAFLCGREALRIMAGRRAGTIVFISSTLSHRGGRGQANYCASKGAIWSLTHAFALEGAPYGVRVNSVSPGYVDTDMTRRLQHDVISESIPLKRVARAEEIASTVTAMCSPKFSYVTGSDFVVDGGMTVR